MYTKEEIEKAFVNWYTLAEENYTVDELASMTYEEKKDLAIESAKRIVEFMEEEKI